MHIMHIHAHHAPTCTFVIASIAYRIDGAYVPHYTRFICEFPAIRNSWWQSSTEYLTNCKEVPELNRVSDWLQGGARAQQSIWLIARRRQSSTEYLTNCKEAPELNRVSDWLQGGDRAQQSIWLIARRRQSSTEYLAYCKESSELNRVSDWLQVGDWDQQSIWLIARRHQSSTEYLTYCKEAPEICGTCHMASTFIPHSRTATATICSTSSLLLLGFTLSRSFHFYCCKRLLGRNNTATARAPHERCQHLLRGALLLSCSVTNLRLF